LLSDFAVTVETAYSDVYPEGIVMKQSIDPGEKAAKGSAITITVSKGVDPSTVVTATTYKFIMTIKAPADTSNVSGATITLYDTAGNTLEQWANQPISSFGTDGLKLSKSGLLVENGKVVITWLDLNGDKISDQNVDSITFIKES
jgi:serine/threonine-protein kinase